MHWRLQLTKRSHLDKEWNAVEAADDDAVVDVTCKDVQRSHSSLDQFLHTYSINVGALCQAVWTHLSTTHINTRSSHYHTTSPPVDNV